MGAEPTMSRRRLLGGAAVLLAAGIPSLGRLALGRSAPGQDELAQRLRLLLDGAAVRPLGRAYAATLPASASGFGLARDILPAGLSEELVAEMTIAQLRGEVAASVAHEYGRGRLEPVGRWLLSPTEARLCALHVVP